MKICPVCQTTYNEALRFCTKDGTALVSIEQKPSAQIASEPADNVLNEPAALDVKFDGTSDLSSAKLPTQLPAPVAPAVYHQPMPPTAAVSPNRNGRKSNSLLFATLGVLIGLGLLGAGVGIWWFSSDDDQVAVTNTNIEAAPTPVSTNQNSQSEEVLTSNVDPNGNLNANSDNNLNLNVNLQTNTNVNLKPTPRPSPSPSATLNERNSNRNVNNRTTLGISIAPVVATTPQPRPTVQPTPSPAQRRTIVTSGGVVNGKATNLPKPVYPSIARSARAAGQVQVVVLINESGNVESARAVSGSPLLRGAAETAARQARFSPTILSGQPVKVSGVIVYNFVL